MNWEIVTVIFIVAIIILVAAFDVFVAIKGGIKSTISQVLLHAALKHPIIPFLFGVLAGHLFWPQ